eukprot:CAMPEP_0196758054 /NCGR_PEP_ID=MMETSP1091-20130531/103983_1 /TAXON_ID=302021 /ORGANISM="Rhodomonas sp., Strain CCMP768" /LENGTH=374 /DNA_ID=CAMNT_0042106857 /DNA_START=203 /DNA_END=1328 /DNA_ORIENTATION=+
MDQETYDVMFDWIEESICPFFEPCCERRNPQCITYDRVASYMLTPTLGAGTDRGDLLRYAGPFLWCKYVPQATAKENATCGSKMGMNPGADPQPCKLWPDQMPAPSEDANWYLAPSKVQSTMMRISCTDRLRVYKDLLRAIYASEWSDGEIDSAAGEFYSACIVDKGSSSFILTIGPIMALLGGVFATLTMLERFNRPPWPDVGVNLLLIGAILLLVGFWSISISTTQEVFSAYAYCGDAEAPLVHKGRWYDQTPCIDRNSLGEGSWNPYVWQLLQFDSTSSPAGSSASSPPSCSWGLCQGEGSWNPFVWQLLQLDSTYIAGGVFSVLATILFLGLVSGFTEKMVGERFGKYLVDTRDLFVPRPNISIGGRNAQ